MEETAIAILDARRVMAISTVRPDGWPQTTIVGYANDGLTVYCLIFRSSQKFANISADPRVSIAVGEEPRDIHLAQAVYASARAAEVDDPAERDRAWSLLVDRHPNLTGLDMPDPSATALLRLGCEHISVLDYRQGLGHTDALAAAGEA